MSIHDEVIDEMRRQNEKWGEQNHAPLMWLSILGEEYGEACKAVIESNIDEYRKELVQVAAVVFQMIECLDRHK